MGILSLGLTTALLNPKVEQPVDKPVQAIQKVVRAKEQSRVVCIPAQKEVVKKPEIKKYLVQEGDSLTAIAIQQNTTVERLWQKNTQLQNQDQLKVGEEITIPSPTENLAERAFTAPVSDFRAKDDIQPISSPKVGSTGSQAPYSAFTGVQNEPNVYVPGWCTWWVKNKRPDIGGYWGNAGYNWISRAQASGFSTGSAPRAGAIGVTAGHVVYVESVNGSTVNISEMGWGGTANSTAHYRSAPSSSFTYIY